MPGFDYLGRHAYHLIVVTAHRAPLLFGARATAIAIDLTTAAAKAQFDVLAFCVMPDHLHILAVGASDTSSAIRFMQRFKQAGGYRFKQETGGELWQWSFFDRVVRREEDLVTIARYIIGNPVRAGLAESEGDWPYAGGSLFADPEQSVSLDDCGSGSPGDEDGAKAPSLHGVGAHPPARAADAVGSEAQHHDHTP